MIVAEAWSNQTQWQNFGCGKPQSKDIPKRQNY